MKRLLLSTIAAAALLSSAAHATLTVTTANGSTGTLIINNACPDQVDGPALSLTGCLNNNHSQDALFTSTENIQFDAGGQAVVVGSDGSFTTLKIDLVNLAIGKLIVDIHALLDGTVSFADNLGETSGLFALDGNGENFFTILASPAVDWVSFTASGDIIADSRHWRVATGTNPPPPPPPVPEPNSVALLGAGLLAMGFVGRRRRVK